MSFSRIPVFVAGIVLGIVFAGTLFLFISKAEAQRALGSYMITHHSNPNAIAGVFRVNQATGYISYCYIDASGKPSVACTPEVP